MRPRIIVNLLAFMLLGLVLTVWAGSSLIHLDAVDKPFTVTAEFGDSPGLHRDLEVTHLGVRVGEVSSVKLRTGHVDVDLHLDRGVRIPANVSAQVLRKSAIGEPYVELGLPTTEPAGPPLKAGDHIPVGRTATTVKYKELFDGVGATLRALDPDDTRTIVHELAVGLRGRGESIHDMIGDGHQLTQTLAANSDLLDDLSVQLTQLTHTVSGHRTELATTVDNLALLTSSLGQSRKNLETVLARGPRFNAQVYQLLQSARPGLGCVLTASAVPGPPLLTPKTAQQAQRLLSLIPTFKALANDTIVHTKNGAYLRATPIITVGGTNRAPMEYARPTPRPVPGPVGQCRATEGSKPGSGARPVKGAPVESGGQPVDRDFTFRNAAATRQQRSPVERMLPLLPVALAAITLLGVAANAMRVVRRRKDDLA